jgi:hypothetical protein
MRLGAVFDRAAAIATSKLAKGPIMNQFAKWLLRNGLQIRAMGR